MQTRSSRHLRAEERETLSLGLARGHSWRTMATVLRRAPSTVSREHARNAVRGPLSGLHGAHLILSKVLRLIFERAQRNI